MSDKPSELNADFTVSQMQDILTLGELEQAAKEGWCDDPYAPLGIDETTRRTANLLRQHAQTQSQATAIFLLRVASEIDDLRANLIAETLRADAWEEQFRALDAATVEELDNRLFGERT